MSNEPRTPVVVLISGRGTNCRALIEGARHYRVIAVLSDRADAVGLTFSREQGIATEVVARSSFPDRTQFQRALFEAVARYQPEFLCLAGFLQLVKEPLLSSYKNRILNIHPSLLPRYAGLHSHAPHEQALAHGDLQAGCTVHLVDEGVDTGLILAQRSLTVAPGDSVDTLAARVLALEHQLYPWVMNSLAAGELTVTDGTVTRTRQLEVEAAESGIVLPESR